MKMAGYRVSYEKIRKCSSLNSPILIKRFSRSQKLRAQALGWEDWEKEYFEENQSLSNNFQNTTEKRSIGTFTANELDFVPFENVLYLKQSYFHFSPNESFLMPDDFLNSTPNFLTGVLFDTNSSYLSTHKAIFTILVPSSQILVVNSAACQLLNYNSDELCGHKLEGFISESQKHKWRTVLLNFLENSSQVFFKNGKLLEFNGKNNEIILVSLYLKRIENPNRCLAIAESINRRTTLITVDENKLILSYDEESEFIFQYDKSELIGLNILQLLPTLIFSKNTEPSKKPFKQNITGRTKNNVAFPVSVIVNFCGSNSYEIHISVYMGLKGLILINRELLITNFNRHYIKFFFGFSKKEIINTPITKLIPRFCSQMISECSQENCYRVDSSLKITNLDSVSEKSNSCHKQGYYGNCSKNNCLSIIKSNTMSKPLSDHSHSSNVFVDSFNVNCKFENLSSFKFLTKNEKYKNFKDIDKSDDISEEKSDKSSQFIETKASNIKEVKSYNLDNFNCEIEEGKYLGVGKHNDGTCINIKYQIKSLEINNEVFYCIWVLKNEMKYSGSERNLRKNIPVCSSFNHTPQEVFFPTSDYNERYFKPSEASIISQCDETLTAGEYGEYYTNIRQIGKGAFGYVKMGFRNSDGLLVITKFIKKEKINVRSWVFDSNLNMKIPLEISLLITLKHPNIVNVLDIFHNDTFFQLVMEKHGAGFDLFEFIDRRPKCDENLISYIFRQIVSAVHYLNSLGILHRDIKDENVIINEKFEIKLIDFGSATFMSTDETFSKFYGTVEYCSPEVLQGNSYKGPELEIWALGVTLYVLTFGENPFHNIEETIRGQFSIPFSISSELNILLHKMLEKNIETRITIDKLIDDSWINQEIFIENYKFEEVVRCYEEEAYPPKYIYEIRSKESFSVSDLEAESSQMMNENNLYNSSRDMSLSEPSDLDDFCERNNSTFQKKSKNSLPALLSSTPVKEHILKPCDLNIGLRQIAEQSAKSNNDKYSSFNDFTMSKN